MRSGVGSLMRCQPRRPTSSGSNTSSENEVRVCDRMSGSMGCRAWPVSGSSSSENGAAERGADSPEKRRRRDEEISAQGMRQISTGVAGVQDSVTESEDGAESSNWSKRTGSKPTITSCSSPEKITRVGVSALPCCSIISRRASMSVLMSRSSNAICLGLEEHLHQFAGEAAGLGEKKYTHGHLIFCSSLGSSLMSCLRD